jgi:hypothetical protein
VTLSARWVTLSARWVMFTHSRRGGPALASVSLAAATAHGARPLCELALVVQKQRASLEGVPLWTVTNDENEFVLLSQVTIRCCDVTLQGRQHPLY